MASFFLAFCPLMIFSGWVVYKAIKPVKPRRYSRMTPAGLN